MGKKEMWFWILMALGLLAGLLIGLKYRSYEADDCAQHGGIMLKTSRNTNVCVRKEVLL